MDTPKGKLIPIGGSEDKGSNDDMIFKEQGILKRLLTEMKGTDSRIEVLTSASGMPRKTGETYVEAFGRLGCTNIGQMHIRKRENANRSELLDRIREADGVLFSGGDQLQLTKIIDGTDVMELIKHRYMTENFIIAGTSAGAMAMSPMMIYQGSSIHSLLKDEIKLTPGLALVDNTIIDSHFMHRGRFGRLAQAVSRHPSSIGIGLGEDTGAIITKGHHMEIIGSGLVIIVDGMDMKYTNLNDVEDGSPLSIENLKVHVLAKGNCYDLRQREFFASSKHLLKTA